MSAIKDFLSSIICCTSKNALKNDKLIRVGGSKSRCLMNSSIIDRILIDVLSNVEGASDDIWTKVSLEFNITQIGATPSPFYLTPDNAITSNDGSKQHVFMESQELFATNVGSHINELSRIINESCCGDGINVSSERVSSTNLSLVVMYDSSWGNDVLLPTLGSVISFNSYFQYNTISNVIETIENPFESCLKKEELCSVRTYLDKRCKTC